MQTNSPRFDSLSFPGRRSTGIAIGLFLCVMLTSTPTLLWAADSTEESIALYADAANFQTSGAMELAIEGWQKFLKEYPNDELASKAAHYLGVCQMQKAEPDYEAAAAAFARALKDKEYELREESLANQGWCYYAAAGDGPQRDEQKLKQAIESFKQLRDESPNSDYIDRAYFYSGEAAYGLGLRERAIRFYDAFLELPAAKDSPLRCDAVYALGIAQEELKQYDAAIKSYRRLLDDCDDPGLIVDVQLRIGDMKIMQSEYPAAIEAFGNALQTAEEDADKSYAIFRQAYALVKNGQPNEAAKKYDQLQTEFPDSSYAASATLASGQSFYRGGNSEEAAKRFRQVLERNNRAAATEAAHWLARIHLSGGEPEEAIKVARQQIEKGVEGDFAMDLKVDLAEALAQLPDSVEASIEVAEKAFRDSPNDPLAPRALYNAAFSSLQVNQFDKAATLAETFLKQFDSDALASDVRFVYAESRLLSGQLDKAVEAYQQLLKQSPKDSAQRPVWVLRTATALNSNRQPEATIELLGQELPGFEQAARKSEGHFLLGRAQLTAEQPEQAAESFARCLELDPQWQRAPEAKLLLGVAWSAAGDQGKAKSTWEALSASSKNPAMADQARYKLAQLASQSGDYQQAIEYYEQILEAERDPGLLPYARYGLGWSAMQLERHTEAIAALDRVIDENRGHPLYDDALIARGICHRMEKQYDAAEQDFQAYLELEPIGVNLGHALYESSLVDQSRSRFERAIEKLTRVIEEIPDYPAMDKVRYELAWSFREAGQTDAAKNQFQQLIENHPNTPLLAEAAYFVGQQHYDAQQWGAAAESFRTASQHANDKAMSEKSLYRLGWALFKNADYDASKEAFREQREKHPDGKLAFDALMMVGEAQFKSGDYEAALSTYATGREAIRERDETANTIRDSAEQQIRELVLLHGGQSAAQLKKWAEAVGWYDELKERFPATAYLPQLFYETGFAYQQQGKNEQALRYFSQVAEKYRRSEVGARARFMMGEIYFGEKQFDKAIPEYQRVMYGFGGDDAAPEIKNWQAKSGFEAGRCGELLMQSAANEQAKRRAKQFAVQFFQYVVQKHADHELAKKSAERLEALQRS